MDVAFKVATKPQHFIGIQYYARQLKPTKAK